MSPTSGSDVPGVTVPVTLVSVYVVEPTTVAFAAPTLNKFVVPSLNPGCGVSSERTISVALPIL